MNAARQHAPLPQAAVDETAATFPAPAAMAAALRSMLPHGHPGANTQEQREPRIAVVIPCHNEAASIAEVIAGFRASLPNARICVFDNASSDGTAEIAAQAGAEVFLEPRKGKGNAVRRMFAEIDADVYVMADGDGTYDASAAPQLVAMILNDRLDMAIGARRDIRQNAHRRGHVFGNRLFNRLFAGLFGQEYTDIFSGYRAFSRRFVKSFPALSSGFEIETELSVHAGQMRLPVAEMETAYGSRAEGSASKLRSIRDGIRILRAFLFLLKETRPILFFGAIASVFVMTAIALAIPLAQTWMATGLVPRLPTAILCVGLITVASLLGVCGIILDSLARARVEQKRILYLAVETIGGRRGRG